VRLERRSDPLGPRTTCPPRHPLRRNARESPPNSDAPPIRRAETNAQHALLGRKTLSTVFSPTFGFTCPPVAAAREFGRINFIHAHPCNEYTLTLPNRLPLLDGQSYNSQTSHQKPSIHYGTRSANEAPEATRVLV
jgi:hypothetical protein